MNPYREPPSGDDATAAPHAGHGDDGAVLGVLFVTGLLAVIGGLCEPGSTAATAIGSLMMVFAVSRFAAGT